MFMAYRYLFMLPNTIIVCYFKLQIINRKNIIRSQIFKQVVMQCLVIAVDSMLQIVSSSSLFLMKS